MRSELLGRSGIQATACAFLAVMVAAAAMVPLLWSADGNPSVVAHVGSGSRLYPAAKRLNPGFRGVPLAGYDGQFNWGVAIDPLAIGSIHRDMDKPSYRYGHPLYGWLGWLLSAGQATAVPMALVVVGLSSLVAAAALAVALAKAKGGSGWAGLFVALNLGLVVAAMNDLAEPLAAALILAALLALQARRRWITCVCLALLPLAKEPLLIVVAAVVASELLNHRRRSAAMFATATIPALLWWIYLRVRLGAWFTTGSSALGLPGVGWGQALVLGRLRTPAAPLYHAVAVAALVALLVVLFVGALQALPLRSPEQIAYLGLAALAACLALNATATFTTALRNVSFLVVLLPFALTADERDKVPSLATDATAHQANTPRGDVAATTLGGHLQRATGRG
jgi:hypothetical protein